MIRKSLVPGKVLTALVKIDLIAAFLQHFSNIIKWPACGDVPLALGLLEHDGLDGILYNNPVQSGATCKCIESNSFHALGDIDGLK